jgi:GLPGLI family protein
MIKKLIYSLVLLLAFESSWQAQISAAKITYERKTNLYKKFKRENDVSNWIKEEDKIKIEYFELFVTDSLSLFRPQESDIKDKYTWATSRNTTYQDFRTGSRYMIKTIWGEELHLTDSLFPRKWKVSGSTRKIAGYTCRKAVWEPNDSTRIYAWFSYDITPSAGPESFYGLPGTILGLATEDGGVVYFAKSVEIAPAPPGTFDRPKKKKIYSVTELKEQLTKQYGHEKWFKNVLYEQFGIW